MAQTVGYVLGGVIGPFAVGVIYDWTGSWQIVSAFYLAVGLASLFSVSAPAAPLFVGARPAVS